MTQETHQPELVSTKQTIYFLKAYVAYYIHQPPIHHPLLWLWWHWWPSWPSCLWWPRFTRFTSYKYMINAESAQFTIVWFQWFWDCGMNGKQSIDWEILWFFDSLSLAYVGDKGKLSRVALLWHLFRTLLTFGENTFDIWWEYFCQSRWVSPGVNASLHGRLGLSYEARMLVRLRVTTIQTLIFLKLIVQKVLKFACRKLTNF